MRFLVPNPDGTAVIEVDHRTATCVVIGCGGTVMRHSLGNGQSIDRCTRCFRRYQVRPQVAASAERSRLRRMFDDFVSWRDD